MMTKLYSIRSACAFILITMLGATSCSDKLDVKGLFFGSSPAANERFAQSKAYNDEQGYRSFKVKSDDYKVYVAADCHIENSNDGLTRFVNDYLIDGEAAPFALFLGDAMEGKNVFSLFLKTIDPIAKCGRALMCTPGNHDLYFDQWDQYIGAMKTGSYLFEVETPSEGKDLYICLDSSDGTLGTDQRQWLGETLASAKGNYRNIIVYTHTHFFKKDNSQGHTSNFNLEEGYDLAKLFKDNGVKLVLSGHDHHFEQTIFKDVTFLTLASIADKGETAYYYKLEVTGSETKLTNVRIR